MPKSILLPSEEETSLEIKFKDGQKPITLDVTDIDNIVITVRSGKIPEDSSFEAEFAQEFYQRYQRRISHSSVSFLCQQKHLILHSVKKNLFEQPEQSGTTEQAEVSPKENLPSSKVSKKSSEQKKPSKTTAPVDR